LPTELPENNASPAYYKSGIVTTQYLAYLAYNKLKNQSKSRYALLGIIIKQEVY
jgi:hypothetical protein